MNVQHLDPQLTIKRNPSQLMRGGISIVAAVLCRCCAAWLLDCMGFQHNCAAWWVNTLELTSPDAFLK